MKDLMKKALTDKSERNTAALNTFVASIATIGDPWTV